MQCTKRVTVSITKVSSQQTQQTTCELLRANYEADDVVEASQHNGQSAQDGHHRGVQGRGEGEEEGEGCG